MEKLQRGLWTFRTMHGASYNLAASTLTARHCYNFWRGIPDALLVAW